MSSIYTLKARHKQKQPPDFYNIMEAIFLLNVVKGWKHVR